MVVDPVATSGADVPGEPSGADVSGADVDVAAAEVGGGDVDGLHAAVVMQMMATTIALRPPTGYPAPSHGEPYPTPARV